MPSQPSESVGVPPALTTSSVLVIAIFGAIIFWFLLRGFIRKKTTSFAMATMALGFPCFVLARMGVINPVAGAIIEWGSIAVGLFVLVSVVKAEHLFAKAAPGVASPREHPDLQDAKTGV